jgi:adenine-specific DNA glycosylase
VTCILLNKTTATQVRHVIFRGGFFERYPTPDALACASLEDLEVLIRPLGMWRKRALGLQRFSKEYRELFWDVYHETYRIDARKCVRGLYGVGEYAEDAYDVFILGAWRGLQPRDKDLARYVAFLEETDGLGVGFVASP